LRLVLVKKKLEEEEEKGACPFPAMTTQKRLKKGPEGNQRRGFSLNGGDAEGIRNRLDHLDGGPERMHISTEARWVVQKKGEIPQVMFVFEPGC